MRTELLLTNEPRAPVETTAELYAIAFDQAETAARRYGRYSETDCEESFGPVRSVFEKIQHNALQRAQAVSLTCVAELSKLPDLTQLNWAPTDLVPAEELLELASSSLTTPYLVWALAVRHRERGFVFWTYVAALAENSAVRAAGEDMAREALHDANELRRERRLAWRSERHVHGEQSPDGSSDIPLAALLESLLQKDIIEWARALPLVVRRHLLAATGNDVDAPMPSNVQASGTIEARRRAIRRAEQLSSIYLDEADHAGDQDQLELTQKLAARAITRLADLRTIAATLAE
ncbi:hypothetical protein FNL55_07900 [Tardiphaga sp. vice352]|uniref:hypothetical protein n=1 Tax=unclassified Tardiphaga TaxID=2631404 RepID=UPI001165AF88|nr:MULTISPECIES: hypothetical protein [unclassified Tardiphaga]QDM15881.1 hypothetical protein FNL53_08175 [Tardiphaga sp. vice278]QDM20981.1 hypothetical protein FIU28_07535 [Tardiphaga sp. vice154]QDM26075.1 hypothetical protein FNL56_08240 [Tardiphaga sp. vice304]QDM31226.1 hypothetical protein FNL55_07900 [Tardiphaga sp. vice352]